MSESEEIDISSFHRPGSRNEDSILPLNKNKKLRNGSASSYTTSVADDLTSMG
jgi:hypothetical protein